MAYKTIIEAIKNILPHYNKEEKSHAAKEILYCEKYKKLIAKHLITLDEYSATLDEYSTTFTEIEKLHKELERFKQQNVSLIQINNSMFQIVKQWTNVLENTPINDKNIGNILISKEDLAAVKKSLVNLGYKF